MSRLCARRTARILAGVRLTLPLLILALVSRSVSAQQCPDGTMPPCGPRPAHAPSVAILFMEPRSRNAADSLLAEGLTLEIINTLSGVARLDVKSRFFSRRIAGDPDPVRSARSFGVDYVVDGVLELDSTRVLVRGALTRTSTGRVVRSLRVERRRAELEGLQVALAQEIAAAVIGRLLPAERARFVVRRVDPRVTELTLRALALSAQFTAGTIRQAIGLAQEAIAIDSAYAPAWVQLALAHSLLTNFVSPDSVAAVSDRGLAANERALALDSVNAAAMSQIAGTRAARNDLSPHTEALARRGEALEADATTGTGLAIVLLFRGEVDEALAVNRATVRRDSLAPVVWALAAGRFVDARRFVEAAGAWEHVLALRPTAQDSFALRRARRWSLWETGDCAGALAAGQSVQDAYLIIESLRCLGRIAEADSVIDAQLLLPTISPASRAICLAWRNQPDSAFAVLDRTFPRGLGRTIQHPAFAPYRQHPAYLALRRRLGLER